MHGGRGAKVFRKKSKPNVTTYPNGTCVKVDGEYWYLQKSFKKKIPSLRVLNSWSFPFILSMSSTELAGYVTAKPLGFRDGTLVKSMSGDVYLISERKRRRVVNPDWLDAAGVHLSDIRRVSDYELGLHEEGEDIT